jgi:hypothetical protein
MSTIFKQLIKSGGGSRDDLQMVEGKCPASDRKLTAQCGYARLLPDLYWVIFLNKFLCERENKEDNKEQCKVIIVKQLPYGAVIIG